MNFYKPTMKRLIFITALCFSFVWLWHLTMSFPANSQTADSGTCFVGIIIEDVVHRTACPKSEDSSGDAVILPIDNTLLADAKTQDYIICLDGNPRCESRSHEEATSILPEDGVLLAEAHSQDFIILEDANPYTRG